MDLKVTIGLTLAAAGLAGFILTFLGSRLVKSGAAWAVTLATAATAFFACRPLAGSYPNWPTTDAVYRAAWSAIPLAILAISFSSTRIPFWIRAIITLIASSGLLVWIFLLYPAPDGVTQRTFLLEWAGIPTAIVLTLWLITELIASRSQGVAATLVIGFIYAGIGAVNLMSSSTKSGNLIGAIGAVVGGALIASMLTTKMSFAHGPVFIWLTLLALLYVPSCYDADAIPLHSLYLILGAPFLALLMEIPFFRKWKTWKRETLRAILLVIPVAIGIVLAYQQMKANGDGDVMLYPQFAAPMCPSQMPIPNTINPPTIT